MQNLLTNSGPTMRTGSLILGQESSITVSSFKILLEMFSQAISQYRNDESHPQPGSEQLANARKIILEFYDYQDDALPSVAVEMFNDRLVGNLADGRDGKMVHSRYQPEALVRYSVEVLNWGLVAGLVAVPEGVTLH